MAVRNLLSGECDVLTFSEDRYSVVGYVPEMLADSQVVGLFLMSNRSYRLADKLGNEFHFDPDGRLTDLLLSSNRAHHARIQYADEFTSAFAQIPYGVEAVGDERVRFLNVTLPKRLKVTDLLHDHSEELTFCDKKGTAAFVPKDTETSRFQQLALLSNGGLLLADNHGNEVRFDPRWRFDSMRPALDCDMVRTISMGNRKTIFNYTISHDGRVVIASAALSEDSRYARPTWVARYEYDQEGRLCRVRRPESTVAARQHSREQSLAMSR